MEQNVGEAAHYITGGISIMNILLTFISAWLIDRVGRRILLLSSMLPLALFGILFTIAVELSWDIAAVVFCVLFDASFAIGMGPIPFIIIGKLSIVTFAQGFG